MVVLTSSDYQRLLDLLISLPILSNEKGREAVLEYAGLQELRAHLDLGGPSMVAIPLMIAVLRSYGRLTYEHEALGRFLNAAKNFVGIDGKYYLENMITKYGLMTPTAHQPGMVDWRGPGSQADILEKIIGENTLRPIAFLKQGVIASRSVAYIEVAQGSQSWSGTGFLVSSRLLMTNNHVLPERDLLTQTIFRFNYELDILGRPEPSKDYSRAANGAFWTNKALDYSIIELAGDPGTDWGYLRARTKVPSCNERVNIIQHPNGLPKQISIQNNLVRFADATRIQYTTSTMPGSSGSPVFDGDWTAIGVHHAGGWLPANADGPLYFRNEAITMGAILSDLPAELSKLLTVC